MIAGNDISQELRQKLQKLEWSPNTYLDLHSPKYNIHYFDPDILPCHIDPMTHLCLMRRGVTPPNCLPTYFEDNVQERIREWLDMNYFKMKYCGVQYLGNELGVQNYTTWEKAKMRILIVRLTSYEVVGGSTAHFTCAEWFKTYCSEDVFVDYAYMPETSDLPKHLEANIPLLFGAITKRQPIDFDQIWISHSPPSERLNLPLLLIKSGIPLFLWERIDPTLPYHQRMLSRGRKHFPPIFIAGIGAQSIESMIADHPVKGSGMCSPFDYFLVGEGENMDLDFVETYLNMVVRDGASYEDFRKEISDQIRHPGVCDPTKVIYEYGDKLHIETNPEGKELSRTVWKQGGRIKATYILDGDGNKIEVSGSSCKETQELAEVQPHYKNLMNKIRGGENVTSNYLKDPNISNL